MAVRNTLQAVSKLWNNVKKAHLFHFEGSLSPREFESLRRTGQLKFREGIYYFHDDMMARSFQTAGNWVSWDREALDKDFKPVTEEDARRDPQMTRQTIANATLNSSNASASSASTSSNPYASPAGATSSGSERLDTGLKQAESWNRDDKKHQVSGTGAAWELEQRADKPAASWVPKHRPGEKEALDELYYMGGDHHREQAGQGISGWEKDIPFVEAKGDNRANVAAAAASAADSLGKAGTSSINNKSWDPSVSSSSSSSTTFFGKKEEPTLVEQSERAEGRVVTAEGTIRGTQPQWMDDPSAGKEAVERHVGKDPEVTPSASAVSNPTIDATSPIKAVDTPDTPTVHPVEAKERAEKATKDWRPGEPASQTPPDRQAATSASWNPLSQKPATPAFDDKEKDRLEGKDKEKDLDKGMASSSASTAAWRDQDREYGYRNGQDKDKNKDDHFPMPGSDANAGRMTI